MSRAATPPRPELDLPEDVEQLRAHVAHLNAYSGEAGHRVRD
jgi:hypothetical protein